MRKKILLIYRSEPSDFKMAKEISKSIPDRWFYEINIINDNYALMISKSFKPDIIIYLVEYGGIDPSWARTQEIYEEIRKIIQPEQKLIRLGNFFLQEGNKDIYYRFPLNDEEWRKILN